MAEPKDWKEDLPEDLKADPTIKDFKDIPSLVKSYKETKALVGASLRVPSAEASAEDKAKFRAKLKEAAPDLVEIPLDEKARSEVEADIWEKLGRPKDEKGYVAEGVEVPQEMNVEALRAAAKRLGMTKAQFKGFVQESVEGHWKAQEARREAESGLRKEWGAAYEERFLSAKATALKFGIPEAAVAAMPPNQVKVWANVAKATGEHSHSAGGENHTPGKLTPEEAELKLSEIEHNPAFLNGRDPQHAHLVKKHAEYMKFLMP